jgi:aryl-alcohol dehydrogenase-like predicted oxidoreductase
MNPLSDVFPFALGCMGLGPGGWYGANSDDDAIATIHAALERGVRVIDTADFYAMGRNEMLVGRALAGARRDKALLSVKFDGQMSPDGRFLGFDACPAATKTACAYTLSRLGVDHIDIYRPARLDPKVPIEDTIGAMADLVKAGYIRFISLSEVGAETIRRAAKVHSITDLQIEYSLLTRMPEAKIIPVLSELDIAMTAYGVLGHGLLTGSKPSKPGDVRAHLPRFEGANGEANRLLAAKLATIAAARGVTPAQLAVAWVRAKSTALGVNIIPTIGARTPKQLDDVVDAMVITLTTAELAQLETAIPTTAVAGARYDAGQMAYLDSEK